VKFRLKQDRFAKRAKERTITDFCGLFRPAKVACLGRGVFFFNRIGYRGKEMATQKFWISSILIAALGVYVGLASAKPTKTGSLKFATTDPTTKPHRHHHKPTSEPTTKPEHHRPATRPTTLPTTKPWHPATWPTTFPTSQPFHGPIPIRPIRPIQPLPPHWPTTFPTSGPSLPIAFPFHDGGF
jgi:hypothetical protein